MTIYKYRLAEQLSVVRIPGLQRILGVQTQGEDVVMWAIVDPSAEVKEYLFALVGTGWDFKDGLLGEYVGTVQDESLVWHVFYQELTKDSPERAQAYVS